ncbi:hypothetical protein H4R35_004604 [Dimargaris xerosporica]|nr:hypothetical protein H4R35_004604 [Dimargaris xerosporica]
MPLRPFLIPETRIVFANNEITQVSLAYASYHSESNHTLYENSPELQRLVQLAVLAILRCDYTRGAVRGHGFTLHLVRKLWHLGEKYRFYKDRRLLRASPYKYNFYLELSDGPPPNISPQALEISEMVEMGSPPGSAHPALELAQDLQRDQLRATPSTQLPPAKKLRHDSPKWLTPVPAPRERSATLPQPPGPPSFTTTTALPLAPEPMVTDPPRRSDDDTRSLRSDYSIARRLNQVTLDLLQEPGTAPANKRPSAATAPEDSKIGTPSAPTEPQSCDNDEGATGNPLKRKAPGPAAAPTEPRRGTWLQSALQRDRSFLSLFRSKRSVKEKVAIIDAMAGSDAPPGRSKASDPQPNGTTSRVSSHASTKEFSQTITDGTNRARPAANRASKLPLTALDSTNSGRDRRPSLSSQTSGQSDSTALTQPLDPLGMFKRILTKHNQDS